MSEETVTLNIEFTVKTADKPTAEDLECLGELLAEDFIGEVEGWQIESEGKDYTLVKAVLK